jgi:hypothetical protein
MEATARLQKELREIRETLQHLIRQQQQQSQPKSGYLRHVEAARYLGFGREKLRRLNIAGKGPEREPDGRYKISKLDEFRFS